MRFELIKIVINISFWQLSSHKAFVRSFQSSVISWFVNLVLLCWSSILFLTFEKILLTALLIGFVTLSCLACFLRLVCSVSSLSRQIFSFLWGVGLSLHDGQAFLELFGYLGVVLAFLRSIVLTTFTESNVLIMKQASQPF